MADEEHEPATLLMPFTVCASNGGPYEDDAFTAGFRLGQLWAELSRKERPVFKRDVSAPCAQQADLMAMSWGYTMTPLSEEHEGWVYAAFVPGVDDEP